MYITSSKSFGVVLVFNLIIMALMAASCSVDKATVNKGYAVSGNDKENRSIGPEITTGVIKSKGIRGSFECVFGNQKVDIKHPIDELTGGIGLVHDGKDFMLIEDVCGPAVLTKYDKSGKIIFRKEEGTHSHAIGVLSPVNKILCVYNLEDKEAGGRSIRMYSWTDGKNLKVVKLKCGNERPEKMTFDDEEEFLIIKYKDCAEERIKLG